MYTFKWNVLIHKCKNFFETFDRFKIIQKLLKRDVRKRWSNTTNLNLLNKICAELRYITAPITCTYGSVYNIYIYATKPYIYIHNTRLSIYIISGKRRTQDGSIRTDYLFHLMRWHFFTPFFSLYWLPLITDKGDVGQSPNLCLRWYLFTGTRQKGIIEVAAYNRIVPLNLSFVKEHFRYCTKYYDIIVFATWWELCRLLRLIKQVIQS